MLGYLAGLQTQLDDAARSLAGARTELESCGAEPAPPPEGGPEPDPEERACWVAWARLSFAERGAGAHRGDLATAEDSCRRSVALFRAVDKVHVAPRGVRRPRRHASARATAPTRRRPSMRGLAVTTPRGELHIRGLALWSLGVDARQDRDLDRAAELAGRSLDCGGGSVTTPGWPGPRVAGGIASERREANRSATLLGAAMRLWDQVGLDPLAGAFIAAAARGRREGALRGRARRSGAFAAA